MRILITLNKALLCIWNWHFANEKVWRNVISRKYGESNGGWYLGQIRGAIRLVLVIGKEWGALLSNARFLVRETLGFSFPTLFELGAQTEALLVDIRDKTKEVEGWSPLLY